MMRCPECGATYGPDARFCIREGQALVPVADKPTPSTNASTAMPRFDPKTGTFVEAPAGGAASGQPPGAPVDERRRPTAGRIADAVARRGTGGVHGNLTGQ